MERKKGYYWVKDIDWFIAEWDGYEWGLAWNEYGVNDSKWEQIDENRITRNEEMTFFMGLYGEKNTSTT